MYSKYVHHCHHHRRRQTAASVQCRDRLISSINLTDLESPVRLAYGVPLRAFLERFNGGGEIHPECGWCRPMGWSPGLNKGGGMRKAAER